MSDDFRDGDIILTREDLVFCAFGYSHPEDRVVCYLKYVPESLSRLFPIEFEAFRWKLGDQALVRSRQLYTSTHFVKILDTFREHFPNYVYDCPVARKEIVAVRHSQIKRIVRPREALGELLSRRQLDPIETDAVELVDLISRESGVPFADLGVRGSISMGIHLAQSDIDLAVFGRENYELVWRAVEELVDDGVVDYLYEDDADKLRKNKGAFRARRFTFNAVKKTEEIHDEYGRLTYEALKRVAFRAEIVEDNDSIFKPAVYGIASYTPLDQQSQLQESEVPSAVVSMIGRYRGLAKRGETVEVLGMLEKELDTMDGSSGFRVVVGSARSAGQEEYLWPMVT